MEIKCINYVHAKKIYTVMWRKQIQEKKSDSLPPAPPEKKNFIHSPSFISILTPAIR